MKLIFLLFCVIAAAVAAPKRTARDIFDDFFGSDDTLFDSGDHQITITRTKTIYSSQITDDGEDQSDYAEGKNSSSGGGLSPSKIKSLYNSPSNENRRGQSANGGSRPMGGVGGGHVPASKIKSLYNNDDSKRSGQTSSDDDSAYQLFATASRLTKDFNIPSYFNNLGNTWHSNKFRIYT